MIPDEPSEAILTDADFQAALVACLERLERGESLEQEQLVALYPQYAEALHAFIQDQDVFQQVASQIRDSRSGAQPTRLTIPPIDEAMDSNPRPHDFTLGERVRYIGEYEILSEIARGGMGIVFKARQQKLKRIVALKMILAGKLADTADVERFHREAQAAGRLKHPNIVPVHEVGEHEGRHYFTMDFVDGRSLAEEIREESLAPRRAAEIVRTAAKAVHFAHEQGTVHRDLKPANVLLTEDGAPHITDFGLAKIMDAVDEDSRAELTASGQILGTPSYMSPEQASGKQSLVGPSSDIYSLGAILYACLTGRAPFVADSPVDTLLQVMRNEPVSPRILNPSIPRDLETICLKCLNKEPHKRYGTAQDLADDLGRFLEGRPVVARPIGAVGAATRWCRRNPAVAALLLLVFMSLAGGTIVSTYFSIEASYRAQLEESARLRAEDSRRDELRMRKQAQQMSEFAMVQQSHAQLARDVAEQEREKAEAERLAAMHARDAEAQARRAAEESLTKAEQAKQEAEEQQREAQWQTYVARLQPMMYRWEQKQYGQLESMLDQAKPTHDDEPDFRGWEWHYLRNLCRQRTFSIDESATFSRHFDWHPKTKRLALFRDSQLEIWAGDPPEFQTRMAGIAPGLVRFSPNGTQLAVADKFKISIVGVGSGKTTSTIDLAAHPNTNRKSNEVKSLEWRPDGTALATGTNMGAIHLWNPESGELIKPITTLPNDYPCNDMHWHPSENVLAIGTRYGLVFAIDTEQDKRVWSKKIDRDYVFTVRWNPGGTMLAGGTGDGSDGAKVVVWDRDGGEKMRSAKRAITGGPTIDWLDDERLVVATTDQDIHQFQVDQDEPLETVRVHDRPVKRILRYGDGRRVISSTSGEIRTTRLDSDVTLAIATTVHKHGIKGLSWAPDSRRVATASWDGLVAITDVVANEVLYKLDGHANGSVNDVAWSPDGLRVASCDHSDEFRIWDPDAGKLLLKFNGVMGLGEFNSVAWIDDDHIVGGQRRVAIYDANSGESLITLAEHPHNFARLAFNTKRQLIGHLGNGRLAIFGRQGHRLFMTRIAATKGLAWSPDGKLLITGGGAGISVIDAMNYKVLTTIRGHAGHVNDVCFSPDGSRIASAGSDSTVRVWDRATGAELLILEYDGEDIFTNVSWSPDGSSIAATTAGNVVTWNASPQAGAHIPSLLAEGAIASAKTLEEELAELTEAIASNPSNAGLVRERGEWYAGQLRWKEALQDFDRFIELNPSYPWEAVCAARAALIINDLEGYQKRLAPKVETLLDKGASIPTVTADFIASTAALVPEAEFDLAGLLPLAQAHSDAKGNALWASRGTIILQLRLGHADEVLKRVDRYNDEKSTNPRIFLDAVRALAHHQLGDAAAAEQALRTAMKRADTAWFTPAEGESIRYSDLGIYVEAKVLLDEAIACVQVPQPAQEAATPANTGRTSTVDDLPSSIDHLDSDDAATRVDALKSIFKLGEDAAAAVPKLMEILDQPDSLEKAWAIRCLGRIGPHAVDAVPKLHEILKSRAENEPQGAKAVPNISMLLFGKPSVEGIRLEAAGALSRIGPAGEVAIPHLIEMLQDPGESVKNYLKPRKVQAPSAEGYAAMLYRTDEEGTYTDARDIYLIFVIGCLANFGSPAKEAVSTIEAVMNDPETLPLVRQAAEQAIKRISPGTTEPTDNE